MNHSAILEVFQTYDLMLLITSFQTGFPWALPKRLKEAQKIIFLPNESSIQLPPTIRHLSCRPSGVFRVADLRIDGAGHDVRVPLHLAIAEGEMHIVRQILRYIGKLFTYDALYCAMNFKQFELLEYFFRIRRPSKYVCASLVRNAQNQKLVEVFYLLDKLGIQLPFKNPGQPLDDLQIVKFIDLVHVIDAARRAWRAGDTESFKHCIKNYRSRLVKGRQVIELIEEVVRDGAFEYLGLLLKDENLEINCNVKLRATQYASKIGRVDCLEWLRVNQLYCGELERCWDEIVANNQFQVLKWMLQHNCYNPKSSFWKRICIYNEEVVEILLEHSFDLCLIGPGTVGVAICMVKKYELHFTIEHLNKAIKNNLYDVALFLYEQVFQSPISPTKIVANEGALAVC